MPPRKQLQLEKNEWEEKFISMLKNHHKRNIVMVAKKLLKRIDGVKASMIQRSKKYEVECTVTIEQLRQLTYEKYGTTCKYLGRPLKLNSMAFDHIIPISKGGTSNIDNIQLICKAANNIKGSLVEEDLIRLLNWLDTVSEELRTDIRIRLAGGKR